MFAHDWNMTRLLDPVQLAVVVVFSWPFMPSPLPFFSWALSQAEEAQQRSWLRQALGLGQ
jgi:hypothetical protein